MMNDTKKMLKMAKYTPGIKTQFCMVLVIWAVGFLYEFLLPDEFLLGSMYLLMPVSVVYHVAYMANTSALMQSSTLKKHSQTVFPYIFVVPFTLVVFSLIVLHRIALAKNGTFEASFSGNYIILSAILTAADLIFISLTYKYMLTSIISLVAIIIALMLAGTRHSTVLFDKLAGGSMSHAIGLSYVLVIFGIITAIVMSSALYRKDLSKTIYKQLGRISK